MALSLTAQTVTVSMLSEVSPDPIFSEYVRTDIPIRVTVTPKDKPAGFLYSTESDKDGFTVEFEPIPGLESLSTRTTFDWIAFGVLKSPLFCSKPPI